MGKIFTFSCFLCLCSSFTGTAFSPVRLPHHAGILHLPRATTTTTELSLFPDKGKKKKTKKKEPYLYTLSLNMGEGSSLMYSFASLRKATIAALEKGDVTIVKPELIITQRDLLPRPKAAANMKKKKGAVVKSGAEKVSGAVAPVTKKTSKKISKSPRNEVALPKKTKVSSSSAPEGRSSKKKKGKVRGEDPTAAKKASAGTQATLKQTSASTPQAAKKKKKKKAKIVNDARFSLNRLTQSYLKYEIAIVDILEFYYANQEFCDEVEGFNTDEEDPFNDIAVLENLLKFNGGLMEFDDEFDESELVFAISLNRTRKRFTVLFRGSVTGGKDWQTNFQFLKTPLRVSKTNLDGFDSPKQIKVHSGFNGYLNDALDELVKNKKKYNAFEEAFFAATTEFDLEGLQKVFYKEEDLIRRRSKFDEISGQILALYEQKEFQDYELYISGHSLGGALSQLLAFQLASGGRLNKYAKAAYPIKAVTFESPMVGDKGFCKAFQQLEKKGFLRHLRVTNEGDGVPVSVPFQGYTQTGMHLYAPKGGKKVEFGYCMNKSFSSQFWAGLSWNPIKSFGDYHGLEELYVRLFKTDDVNPKILKGKTVEDLYTEYAEPVNFDV